MLSNVGHCGTSKLHSTSIGTEMYMNYVFWAFKLAIEGFKYCRPVICIDGTHLYGKYEGKIVAATAVTAADKIIPLAFAVVDKEMIESWGWFITLLRRHVCRDREGVTLISDQHIALLSVLSRIWDNPAVQPRGYHRYCLRHVCSNFNEKFDNTVAKDLVWRAGSARQVRKFNKIMDDIYKLEKNAERWFRRMNPIHWTLCHDGGCRWGILTTNHIEGFNGVLKGARSVPITASVEITFYRLVKYFDEGRTIAENASNRGHLYTTNVQRWIDEHQAKANVHMLVPINRGIGEYEVRTAPHGMGGGARQIVSLRPPSCSCGKYTLFHLSCSHMLAVTADLGEDPFPFVAPEYRLEVHKRIFAQKFRPMPHEQYWPNNDYPTLLAILARQREVKTGRPQHSRIHNEMDTSRQSGLHHCSLCLQRGHDKRKCPARIRSIRHCL
ncbi:unnamed protein product [Camellia sinensis]